MTNKQQIARANSFKSQRTLQMRQGELIWDLMKEFKHYFPKNNYSNVIKQYNSRQKKVKSFKKGLQSFNTNTRKAERLQE
jgi:hypothetical protein